MKHQSIGHCLRKIREKRGLTQRALAEAVHIDHAFVARAELDQIGMPAKLMKSLWPLLTKDEKQSLAHAIVDTVLSSDEPPAKKRK